MQPVAILGYSILWYDDFRIVDQLPYRKWDTIVGGTKVNNEVQRYDSMSDVTHIRSIYGGPPPHKGDSLFITPQYKDGEWRSARVEGKEAYSCPDGKSLILQAEIQVGTAPSDQQAGIWPAFWAMGQTCQRKDGSEKVPWPECGEWDILETSDGHDWTLGSIHWGVKNPDGAIGKKDWPTAFGDEQVAKYGNKYDHTKSHTWALKVDRTQSNWKDETIQWLMDGDKFFEMKGSDVDDEGQWAVLAHEPYFPILNVAVGGNFPKTQPVNGKTGTGTDTGMEVQYVAFYISD